MMGRPSPLERETLVVDRSEEPLGFAMGLQPARTEQAVRNAEVSTGLLKPRQSIVTPGVLHRETSALSVSPASMRYGSRRTTSSRKRGGGTAGLLGNDGDHGFVVEIAFLSARSALISATVGGSCP